MSPLIGTCSRMGDSGFVLPQNLFKTSGAGQGFRRFILPDGTPFGPLVVDDMVEIQPFEGATNRTAVAVFAKGRSVRYPVSYQYWKKRDTGRGSAVGFDTPYEEVTAKKVTWRSWFAEPVDARDKTSSWIVGRRKAIQALRNVLGPSKYRAREGTNTGGANGVFWMEITGQRPGGLVMIANATENIKRDVPDTQAALETELLYPLLRGRDVQRWSASPSLSILLTHLNGDRLKAIPVETMQRDFPRTYSYLVKFKDLLVKRAAFKRYFKIESPFYSIFNIGDYTFGPWKVVWREQSAGLMAAVVGPHDKRPVVPITS